MEAMKLWRKSRFSESHANSFVNGRMGAIYAIAFGLRPSRLTLGKVMQASLSSRLIGAFAMLAAFSLVSCSSDHNTDTYEATELGGTWQKVYDEGIAR